MSDLKTEGIALEIEIEELEPIIAPDNGELFFRCDATPGVKTGEWADGERLGMAA